MILLLAHFPTLFEDELLYSGIARYHRSSGNRTQKQTVEDLFGDKLVCSTVDLPSHLAELSRRLQASYSVERLIQNHTLFSYYSYYLNEDKCAQVKALMMQGTFTGAVHASLGLIAGLIKSPTFLKYCPVCYQEESGWYEPYWHRSHQLPGVVFCEKHKVPLRKSNVIWSTRDHKFTFIPISQLVEDNIQIFDIGSSWEGHLRFIADQSARILKSSSQKNTPNYTIALQKKGYLTVGNRTRINKLIHDFKYFYTEELLHFLQCDITSTGNDTWLHKLARGNGEITQPLRHLLLCRFLNQSTETETLSNQFKPFGDGPWPCLNKVASHHGTMVIENCNVTRCSKTSLPVGTFRCTCGFVYSRTGPDINTDDRFKIGRIKAFGHLWYEKLEELKSSNNSLRTKAKMLGVDPKTVKKQSGFLSLHIQSFDYSQSFKAKGNITKRNIPISAGTLDLRVDWGERDEFLVLEVRTAIKKIKIMDEPHRITVSSIVRNISSSDLSIKILKNSLEKLPLTKELIESSIESTEAYQLRRLIRAANRLQESELSTGWRILKLAGLNHPLRKRVLEKYNELILK